MPFLSEKTMCDINFETTTFAEPDWEDRMRAERTALVETYLTGERHWPTEFGDKLPQGPLSEAQQDSLDEFTAELGKISVRTANPSVVLELPVSLTQVNPVTNSATPTQLA